MDIPATPASRGRHPLAGGGMSPTIFIQSDFYQEAATFSAMGQSNM